jgi:hypothetical protein
MRTCAAPSGQGREGQGRSALIRGAKRRRSRDGMGGSAAVCIVFTLGGDQQSLSISCSITAFVVVIVWSLVG